MTDDDLNKPPTGAEFDIDRLITLYGQDGTSVMVTPRHLMEGSDMTLEQVLEVERFGEKYYRPVHDALVAARKAGVPEADIERVFAAHKDADGQ
jgi:hypothetical protein